MNNKDAALIWERFLQGDDKSFATLFDLFSDPLFRYGTKFLNDEELVKDCVQNLFIKLYKNRASLPISENPKFYLFKAMKNLLIDEIRTSKQQMVYISPQELHFSSEYYFDPEEETESEEEAQVKIRFEKALNLLTDRQKEAIYLRYQMEMPYDAISQLLGINYQSARNLIHRAVEKVREEMDWALFLLVFLKYIH